MQGSRELVRLYFVNQKDREWLGPQIIVVEISCFEKHFVQLSVSL